ncbi:MAG TPA: PKD-like domain-containing protein, partial [Ohtaekwangia sp.]|uniref:PKD-like domain-containing protein n=1 Tax=Ohtaekwangia sp. TaxID=2066019 RepID=UPI002F93D06C
MKFFYLAKVVIISFVLSVGFSGRVYSQCAALPPITGLGSDKFPDKLCSPVTADVNYRISFAGTTTIGPTYELIFNWGDGSALTVVPLTAGTNSYNITQNHAFPANSDCEYQVIIVMRINGVLCTNTRQVQVISTWRTDEFNGGDVRLLSPATGTPIHEVCEGENIDVIFEDQTNWNCNANFASNYPPNDPVQFPNEQYRWQQIVYNTVPITLDKIPNISVNGVPVTGAAGSDILLNYQDPRGVHYLPPLVVVNDGDRRDALRIQAPGGFTAGFPKVGDEFRVTIRYWNICNPYDNNFADGNLTPTNGDLINGDNPPVERTAIIRIIDAPDRPVVADRVVCYGDIPTTTLTVTNVQANITYRWYATLADAQANVNVINTGATFTPNAAQAPVGVNDYYVTGTQTNNCVSEAEEVILTRRENISTSPAALVLPQTNVCPNTTYIYSLPSDPATEPTGGATEYIWSVVPAANATITGGQGTKQITLQTNGTLGAFTLQVIRRFINAPQCPSNPRNTVITVRANPTASITPSPLVLCEGATPMLDGNPSNPFGTIVTHTWTGAIAIIDDPTIQTPTILATATSIGSPFTLNYTVTNDIGCTSVPVSVLVTINDNPAVASVGADQALCGTLTSLTMGGSDPTPGTGTWTFVSSVPARPAPTISNIHDRNATITISSGNEGAYTMRWTVKNGACQSSADVVIDLGSNPTDPAAGTDKAVCGENFTLEGNTPIIGAGKWTVVSGPGGCVGAGCNIAIVDLTDPTSDIHLVGPPYTYGAYTLRWTISSGTCTPEMDDVIITFNQPGIANVPADFVSCVDQTVLAPINLTGATVGGGATQGRWEIATGSGIFTSNNANPGATRPAANTDDQYKPSAADFAAGFVQLRFVALDPDGIGPCGNVSSAMNLKITFDQKPANANAGTDFAICEGDDATLAAIAVNNGGVGTWSPVTGVTDINDESAVVTGLTTTTTFTWTVKSALGNLATPPNGSCAATTDDVIVTVNPLPEAIDPTPSDLCETIAGTLTATGVTLSVYDDDVIGAATPADRQVKWYATAFDQVNDINPITTIDVHNNDKLYIRVIDLTTAPLNCDKLQEINFTVNPKPVVAAQSFSYCEEAPAGTGRVDDIDLTLTSVGDAITVLPAADRVITWHTTQADAEANVNPLATPNDIDITTNTIYFARVQNIHTGCYNVAQIDLIVKPLPSDPIIVGKADPCKNGSELFRVTQIPGAVYTWSYPATFQYLGGGGPNDFYILLSFPNAVTDNISVKVSVNGCESNVVTKAITVSDDPQGYSIVPPNVDICENGIYEFKVSPNNSGSSTYNWQVLKQSDGLPGGGIVADGQTTGVVQIQFLSQDVFVKVSESNASGCTGPPTQIPVAVNKRPLMDNITTSICSGDVIGVVLKENASSPVQAATFNVQVPSVLPGIIPVSGPTQGVLGSNGIENDSYKNQTVAQTLSILYRVKPISALGCEGEEKSVTVDIKAEPVMDISLGKAVCSDNPIEVTLRSAIGFFPADKFVIESIVYDPTKLTPLDPLPATGTLALYDPNVIYSHRWENVTSADVNVTYNIRPYSTTTGCYGNPSVPIVLVIQRKPLVTPVTLAPICSGDVLNIPLTSPNVTNATFVWSVYQVNGNITGATGSTTNVITDKLVNNSLALGSVVYEVRATNPSSSPVCSGPPEYITVTVRPSPDITTPLSLTSCSDGYGGNTIVKDLTSLNAQVSTEAGVTYTWFTDANDFANSQIPPVQVTAYTLTDDVPVFVRVLNPAASSGCYKDATLTYDVRPTPQLTADPVETTDPRFNITCNGLANGQVVVSAQYGTNHTFSKDGTTFVPTVLFTNLAAGNYTIYTRNAEGCVDSAPISIIQPDPIVPGTPTVTDVSCFNDPAPDGIIQISAIGGTSAGGGDPLIFSLLQDSNAPYDAVNQQFTGLRATTYTVRIEDKNGCTKFVPNVVVKQPNDLSFSIDITSDYNGYDVSCAGQTDGQISVDVANITGGNPGYTYTLDQDPLNLTGQTDGSFEGLSANILYTITVTDTKGCKKTSLPELLIDPIPLFAGVIGFDKDICEGADPTAFQELSQPFGGIGNYVYRWEESSDNINFVPAAGVNNNPIYDPPSLTDLTYYRRVVSSGTCAEDISDVVKVVVHALPQATLSAPSEVCENGFFTLDFKFTNGQ